MASFFVTYMSEFVAITKKPEGALVLGRARWCRRFFCRLRGLTFRRRITEADSLILVENQDSKSATAIHMFFVFFSIAAIWIDSSGRVVDKCLARPFRPIYVPREPARYVLEGPPDLLTRFEVGEQIEFQPTSR